ASRSQGGPKCRPEASRRPAHRGPSSTGGRTMNAAAARDDNEEGRGRPAASPLHRASRPPATSSATVWIARLAHRTLSGTDEHSLVLVNSDRFPAGTPV